MGRKAAGNRAKVTFKTKPVSNLVGIWKGDPLAPARAGHHVHPVEIALRRAARNRAVQPHRRLV
jgi:hypothetical protein